ncbi:MAG: hypothetical protein M1814_001428 [Vezdaea aestivalis]|nr:MAG: hypothetical protein M1814_001428 [Vezdaea aestivalis]
MDSQIFEIDSQERRHKTAAFMQAFGTQQESFEISQNENTVHHGASEEVGSVNADSVQQKAAKMSTQGTTSSNAKTQPLSPGAHDEYLRKHADGLADDYSPEIERIQPISESKRFQTPGAIARLRDNDLDSPYLPQNPLLGLGDSNGGMGMSQIFNNTQLPTSPYVQGDLNDPSSDRPSPAVYYTTRQVPVNLSSPSQPRRDFRSANARKRDGDLRGNPRHRIAPVQLIEEEEEEEEERRSDEDETEQRDHIQGIEGTKLAEGRLSQKVVLDDIEDEEEADTQIAASVLYRQRKEDIGATPEQDIRSSNRPVQRRNCAEVVAVADSQPSPQDDSTSTGLPPLPLSVRDRLAQLSQEVSKDSIEESSLIPPPPIASSYQSSSQLRSRRSKDNPNKLLSTPLSREKTLTEVSSPPALVSGSSSRRRSPTPTTSQETDKENRNPQTGHRANQISKEATRAPEEQIDEEARPNASEGTTAYQTAQSQNSTNPVSQKDQTTPRDSRFRTLTDIAGEDEPDYMLDNSLLDIRITNTQDNEFNAIVRSSDESPIAASRKRKRTVLSEPSPTKVLDKAVFQKSPPLLPHEPFTSRVIERLHEEDVNVITTSSPLSSPPEDEFDHDSPRAGDDVSNSEPASPMDHFALPPDSPPKRRRLATYSTKGKKAQSGKTTTKAKRARNNNAKKPPLKSSRRTKQVVILDHTPMPPPASIERISPPTYDTSILTAGECNDLPVTETVSHPTRVLAKFRGGTNAFYPATVVLGLPSHSSNPSRLKISFDDGTTDVLDSHSVRSLSFRPGDSLKVDLPKMRTKNYVLCSLKNHHPPNSIGPNGQSNITAVTNTGYAIAVLAQRNRDSGTDPILLTDAVKVDVPIANIYVTPANLVKFDDRPYVHQPSSIQPPLPTLPLTPTIGDSSTATTPTSLGRNRGRSKGLPQSHTGSPEFKRPQLQAATTMIQSSSKGLLATMAFALSYADEVDKTSLNDLIVRNGGTILPAGFEELFTPFGSSSKTLDLAPAAKNLGFVALLADKHSRKPKFMQALALGLPCLSGLWVEKCVRDGQVCSWESFLLAAGESRELEGAVVSRTLRVSGIVPFESLVRTEPMVKGNLVFLGGKTAAKRATYWFLVRAIAGIDGEEVRWADRIEEVEVGEGCVVFVAGGQRVDVEAALKKRKSGLEKLVTIVEDEDVLQSLILGRLVDV